MPWRVRVRSSLPLPVLVVSFLQEGFVLDPDWMEKPHALPSRLAQLIHHHHPLRQLRRCIVMENFQAEKFNGSQKKSLQLGLFSFPTCHTDNRVFLSQTRFSV